jgi:hypothetical protein
MAPLAGVALWRFRRRYNDDGNGAWWWGFSRESSTRKKPERLIGRNIFTPAFIHGHKMTFRMKPILKQRNRWVGGEGKGIRIGRISSGNLNEADGDYWGESR